MSKYVGKILSAQKPTVSTTNAQGIFDIVSTMQYLNDGMWPSGPILGVVDYLVVAGGGGGGGSNGGGGGAGGVLYGVFSYTKGQTYTVTVGAGGNGGVGYNVTRAYPGANSAFGSFTAIGGGYGGTEAVTGYQTGGSGGSGGGGQGYYGAPYTTPGKGTYPGSTYLDQARQGYDGGTGNLTARGGGGGGGRNAAGADSLTGTNLAGGKGGAGYQWINNSYYAGGGSGGSYNAYDITGGTGGGGTGYGSTNSAGGAGTVNTGGGGGGGYNNQNGGAGGSGVVILRVATGTTVTVTGTPSTNTTAFPGYTLYTFTQSGSFNGTW